MCWSTTASVRVDGKPLATNELGFVEPGADSLELTADEDDPAAARSAGRRSVSRSSCGGTSSAASTRRSSATGPQWEALLETGSSDRFALPTDDPLEALHAPPLPNARMVKRGP